MQKTVSMNAHPMVIFWLGLITGAVIVSLVFLYKVLSPTDFESSIFRNPKVPRNFENKYLEQQIMPTPVPHIDQQINPKTMPTPVP